MIWSILNGVPFGQTNIKTRTVSARPGVNCVRVRRVKGKKGVIREQHDLIVNIDLVRSSFRYKREYFPPKYKIFLI